MEEWRVIQKKTYITFKIYAKHNLQKTGGNHCISNLRKKLLENHNPISVCFYGFIIL